MRTLIAIAAALILAGCGKPLGPGGTTGTAKQSQPIAVTGTRHTYDVMFVVDRSGSMTESPDGSSVASCDSAGQHNAPCKWDALLGLMSGSGNFLDTLSQALGGATGSPPQLGLVTFGGVGAGSDNACAPGVLQVPFAPSTSSVTEIQNTLLGLSPQGGTPTASSVTLAGSAFSNDGADRYVILLTDGAPNCDAAFQATELNCGSLTQQCVSPGACFGQSASPLGCLDEDASVQAVQALHDQLGVTTLVIGFGADFADSTNLANETLDRMAQAGGAPRTDASGNAVEPAFYFASDAQALVDSFHAAGAYVQRRCGFSLSSAAPANFNTVELDSGSAHVGLAPSKLYLSGDRKSALVVDGTACTTVTGSSVTFKFSQS